MAMISRREFIAGAAASAGLAGAVTARAAEAGEVARGPLGLPIGSQTWPTRSMLGDFPAYVKMMADGAAKAGMQQGLDNEGFEVSMVDGKRTYDLLLELLDPQLVKFQFQMSTIAQGFVAAEYFLKYPGRFFSMHLQDVDMSAPEP